MVVGIDVWCSVYIPTIYAQQLTVVSKVVIPLQTYTKMSASEQCSITLASVSLLVLRPGLHKHTQDFHASNEMNNSYSVILLLYIIK